jgi:hypothetical protein
MKRLTLAIAPFIACAALAAEPVKAPESVAVDVTLPPGKIHEECARLEPGDKRAYHWKANAPVDFNIHYHAGAEVFFPVKRDAMRGDGGTFTAKTGEDYCWMWTARDKAAKVDGRIAR